MDTFPVANARMYSATPSVKADWKQLFAWVLERAGLPWRVIDYDAPAPLSVLWTRNDLGLAMMCGLPFARRGERPTLIAAPVPSPARYAGKPVYFTDIVVRADSPFQTLEDTFGGVIGYTLIDSMSGGVALRCHLEAFQNPQRPRLYRKTVGGFINARHVIEALVAGTIDAGPLDSYYYDLLKRNDPAFAAQVRLVASTAAMPIPPLVATAELSDAELSRLRAALLAVDTVPEVAPLLEHLQLSGFALAEPESFKVLAEMADSVTTPFEDI
ncbi:MAG: PhnD/SsuA/transferrin family substrate-binding protein [Polaromonas sp.]|nr:PhnD/SsuA/transferrin family substrate-binding protein [Polaromonas sp.]